MAKRTRSSSRTQRPAAPKAPEPPETQTELLAGEDDLLEFEETASHRAVIKVVGVGGGGGNALNNMVTSGLGGVDFIAANTDAQALQYALAPTKIQLGGEVTRGLGCGADPNKGRDSALEVRERLRELFVDTDMVFVTAGLGGGTGTGAAPIVAEVARGGGGAHRGCGDQALRLRGPGPHASRGAWVSTSSTAWSTR